MSRPDFLYTTDAMSEFDPVEFDCVECGRHIISIGNNGLQETHPNTCAACWSIPGWFTDPEIAGAIDPDFRRKPRPLQ